MAKISLYIQIIIQEDVRILTHAPPNQTARPRDYVGWHVGVRYPQYGLGVDIGGFQPDSLPKFEKGDKRGNRVFIDNFVI